MDNHYSEKRIKHIMSQHGAGFSKKLGQNFLTDYSVIEAIVDGAGLCEQDYVVEIGPGIGVLTCACAERAGFVTAVELDRKLIPILGKTLSEFQNIEIINEDILKVDIGELWKRVKGERPELERMKIVGNLPYYITTPIIMKLLEDGVQAESITIMMQKEVADRLKASPGTKAYGAITVSVQYYCTVEEVVQVPKESFVPSPKVDSTVLRLDIRKEKPVILKDESRFFEVIKAGFGQRRKTLLNTLTGYQGYTKEEMSRFLTDLGIDPVRRAETLSIEEFAAIANAV